MSPITVWDTIEPDENGALGWSVMGTLREHQESRRRLAEERRQHPTSLLEIHRQLYSGRADHPRRQDPLEPEPLFRPARTQQDYEAHISGHWHGGPAVLAFLFAFPDSDAIRMLDTRGEYFDIRTGETWDLFFPGYFSSVDEAETRRYPAARPVGRDFASTWYFSVSDFDALRLHVEQASERRWQYSGGSDLVLVNGWMPAEGEPTIDWASTISGQLTEQSAGALTLTLAGVVERITLDFQTGAGDAVYGVPEVTGPPPHESGHAARDFMISTLSGIAAALGARALGL